MGGKKCLRGKGWVGIPGLHPLHEPLILVLLSFSPSLEERSDDISLSCWFLSLIAHSSISFAVKDVHGDVPGSLSKNPRQRLQGQFFRGQ